MAAFARASAATISASTVLSGVSDYCCKPLLHDMGGPANKKGYPFVDILFSRSCAKLASAQAWTSYFRPFRLCLGQECPLLGVVAEHVWRELGALLKACWLHESVPAQRNLFPSDWSLSSRVEYPPSSGGAVGSPPDIEEEDINRLLVEG